MTVYIVFDIATASKLMRRTFCLFSSLGWYAKSLNDQSTRSGFEEEHRSCVHFCSPCENYTCLDMQMYLSCCFLNSKFDQRRSRFLNRLHFTIDRPIRQDNWDVVIPTCHLCT
ncbi:hypothetical protein AHF37_04863 [Paragonimus kellicotti]|nr:hypothetical protein AHF37_04863 [Paragonimus kellicotti]